LTTGRQTRANRSRAAGSPPAASRMSV